MQTENRIVMALERFGNEVVPDAVRQAAINAVIDWLGCAIGGADSDLARALARHVSQDGLGDGPATVLQHGLPTASARDAALVNGAVSHVLELDDIYAPALYHPGVCVIPAALAACQVDNVSGERFLRAVIAGYELSNRLGTAINPQHYRYWHTTGTVGTIGAVVAAALALKLCAERSAWAIGNAASMAAGLKQAFASDGMTKPLHAGRAAEAGVAAALMARAGVTGATDMVSGPSGFIAAMGESADPGPILDDLFADWTITRPTLKRFASCGHCFAAVDGALDLREGHAITARDIARVEVQTYSAAISAAGKTGPRTAFEARFSLSFCVAAALFGKDLSDPDMFVDAVSDDAIQALSDRVAVTASTSFDARFPNLRGASVRIVCRDGAVHDIEVPTRKGAPENALDANAVRTKAARLIARGGGDSHAWITWCEDLPDALSVNRTSMPTIGEC